jgi:hypothetical protein
MNRFSIVDFGFLICWWECGALPLARVGWAGVVGLERVGDGLGELGFGGADG